MEAFAALSGEQRLCCSAKSRVLESSTSDPIIRGSRGAAVVVLVRYTIAAAPVDARHSRKRLEGEADISRSFGRLGTVNEESGGRDTPI